MSRICTPIALVTERRYVNPAPGNWYTDNILEDDRRLAAALHHRGLKTERVDWSHPGVDWSGYQLALIRTPWDYFERLPEFFAWLEHIEQTTTLLNPAPLVRWNIDKHYLAELETRGVHSVPTVFIEQGEPAHLAQLMSTHHIEHGVIKPTISAGAQHTYRINLSNAADLEPTIQARLEHGAMMLQPFQNDIVERGETTLVVIDGRVTHAVRKIAKAGDFRVQDDHGGSVHRYGPTPEEVAFAERVIGVGAPDALYGRVDMIRDNDGALAVMELELIEPELWLRMHPPTAEALAAAIVTRIEHRMSDMPHSVRDR